MTEELKQTWKGLTRPQKIAVLKQAEIGECIAPRELDRYIWVEAIRYLKACGLARVAFIEGGECEAISLTSKGRELLISLAIDATKLQLPSELEIGREYFIRAIQCSYMKITATGGKWLQQKARLGYFCMKAFPSGRPLGVIERFFDVRKLSSAITQAGYEPKRTDVKLWRADIDSKIFFD